MTITQELLTLMKKLGMDDIAKKLEKANEEWKNNGIEENQGKKWKI